MYFIVNDKHNASLMAFAPSAKMAETIAKHLASGGHNLFFGAKPTVISAQTMLKKLKSALGELYDGSDELGIVQAIIDGKLTLDWTPERFNKELKQISENETMVAKDQQPKFVFVSDSVEVHNPYISQCGRTSVYPILYYGKAYLDNFNAIA
jgi:hypothetical protein